MSILNPVKSWRNQKKIKSLLGQVGKIVSYSLIHVPPAGFEAQAPYPVVLVDLGNKRLLGQLVDYKNEELKIGQKVRSIIRRIKEPDDEGVIPYGIKFKPV